MPGKRMSRVVGRSDDMLIIRGVNVFPSQVEETLLRVEGTAPHYLIEISRPGALDEAVVKVEVRPGDFSDRDAAEGRAAGPDRPGDPRRDRRADDGGLRGAEHARAVGGKARRVLDHRNA